ncbi:MAG: cyclase family protein [Candidatus Binataceae bacterium]
MRSIDTSNIIDLTHPLDQNTIHWPTDRGFHHQLDDYGMTSEGYFYAAGHFTAPEHAGTHMDAPLHFNRDGAAVGQVALTQTIGPAAVIDFSSRATTDSDATLAVADIEQYELLHGRIPDGAIVVARSGWGRLWSDPKRYMGTDSDVTGLRFPGFSAAAAALLLKRRVIALAIDTASLDPGNSRDFPVHRLWLGANRVGFENLCNADKLPHVGATIFCAPMKIRNGTGAPARIFALLP